jgi:hypothetical protein
LRMPWNSFIVWAVRQPMFGHTYVRSCRVGMCCSLMPGKVGHAPQNKLSAKTCLPGIIYLSYPFLCLKPFLPQLVYIEALWATSSGHVSLAYICSIQGCQIFLGIKHPNGKKYQMTVKNTKGPHNRPNGHTIYHTYDNIHTLHMTA